MHAGQKRAALRSLNATVVEDKRPQLHTREVFDDLEVLILEVVIVGGVELVGSHGDYVVDGGEQRVTVCL